MRGQQSDDVIVVRGLKSAFGEQIVHDGLDLSVRRGEIFGVVGGSGTGKSVLMRSIIGLQLPVEGTVEVFGESTLDREEIELTDLTKRWGVLFQGGALFSTLTVAENVQVPLREFYPNLDAALLDEIAAYKVVMTGLPADAGPKYPAELSGGMKKRAGLARALAMDPELLFLDEPTAGLDPIGAAAFDELTKSLQKNARADGVPHHARSGYALRHLRPRRRAGGQEGHRGGNHRRASRAGPSVDPGIFQGTARPCGDRDDRAQHPCARRG